MHGLNLDIFFYGFNHSSPIPCFVFMDYGDNEPLSSQLQLLHGLRRTRAVGSLTRLLFWDATSTSHWLLLELTAKG